MLKIKHSPKPGSKKPRTRWYRALTKSRYAVILKIERALPADGQPLDTVTEVTAWLGTGRLLLFAVIYLKKQAANANNENTNLNQVRICNHHGQPSSLWIRGQEAAPCQEGQPPTVTGSAERSFFPAASISQLPAKSNKEPPPVLLTPRAAKMHKYHGYQP